LTQLAKFLVPALADAIVLESRCDGEHPKHQPAACGGGVKFNVEHHQPPSLAVCPVML
jgi:hypothetical protein